MQKWKCSPVFCRRPALLAITLFAFSIGLQNARAEGPSNDCMVSAAQPVAGFGPRESNPAQGDDLGPVQPTLFQEPRGAPEPSDRPLGSAFFGYDSGPPLFAVSPGDPGKEPTAWPDISEPGPDMGNFPNSAFTLPKGRAYVEVSPVTLFTRDRQNPQGYIAPYLLRYGLTNDVEFRLFGNGLTHVGGSVPTTGFSPLNLDLKIHLWNDRKEWLIPAVSLEVFLLTPWGSSAFTSAWEPSLNLNFDLPITKRIGLEWTLGYGEVQQAINTSTNEVFVPRFNFLDPAIHRLLSRNFNQFSAQWAIQYEVNEQLDIFVHGFHNGAMLFNLGTGEMVGLGGFWKFNSRLTAFGSVNTGLTPNLPSLAAQFGFALAL